MIIVFFLMVGLVFGLPGLYYAYMKKKASEPWNLDVAEHYMPSVAVVVPMYNEEKSIGFKLKNLLMIDYPPDRVEIILVNDASTDRTRAELDKFKINNPSMCLRLLDRPSHEGKTASLNFALKQTNAEIVVISDSDCFWPANLLQEAMPFLSDPNVGAIAAREVLLNDQTSWNIEGELFYRKNIQLVRVGESKVHSTVIFQGGFAAFKRDLLQEFDKETDDSGTAFSIVQKNKRTLLVSSLRFYTTFPSSWRNRILIKTRRANQLQRIWFRSLKLLVLGDLLIPKRIALGEIFLHIINPILFVSLIITGIVTMVEQPVFLSILLLALPILLITKSRMALLEFVQNNFILLLGLLKFFGTDRFKVWKPVQESRSLLSAEILEKNHLI